MKRLFVLPAAVLIQTCLGGVYAWSAFVPSLGTTHGLSAGQTQFIFGLTIASFTVAMVPVGRLTRQWGPRWVALLGGLLFACGHLLSAASGGRFLWLLVGFGLVGGASIGFGYVAALTTGIQWFPKHRGLVTGVAVAGFGAGAVLLSRLTLTWLGRGWTVLDVFRAIGWIYGTAVCLGALLLFRPPNAGAGAGVNPGAGTHLLKDPLFRSLAVGMFCGTFAGLLVIGNLKPIGIAGGLSPAAAAMAISFFAAGNALGRLAWGCISDRLGYAAIPLALLFLGVAVMVLLPARLANFAFSAAALLVGFGFGASFVLYAAQVAAHYGAAEVGRVYPLLFLAYGVSGLTGPPIGGLLYDLTGGHASALAASVLVVLVGICWTWRARIFVRLAS